MVASVLATFDRWARSASQLLLITAAIMCHSGPSPTEHVEIPPMLRPLLDSIVPRDEVVSVDLYELPHLGRDLVLSEDRVHWAGLHARITIDAFLWVNVELLGCVIPGLVRGRVDAVDRTHLDA
jgi:hypothetical protein